MSSLSLSLRGAAREAVDAQIPGLIDHEFASRLAAQDHTLWGPSAEDEASKRLGWVSLFEDSRELLPRIARLRAELTAEGVDRVVLAGMGGSSLAPEVICATGDVALTVLDSTDPQHVAAVVGRDTGHRRVRLAHGGAVPVHERLEQPGALGGALLGVPAGQGLQARSQGRAGGPPEHRVLARQHLLVLRLPDDRGPPRLEE